MTMKEQSEEKPVELSKATDNGQDMVVHASLNAAGGLTLKIARAPSEAMWLSYKTNFVIAGAF